MRKHTFKSKTDPILAATTLTEEEYATACRLESEIERHRANLGELRFFYRHTKYPIYGIASIYMKRIWMLNAALAFILDTPARQQSKRDWYEWEKKERKREEREKREKKTQEKREREKEERERRRECIKRKIVPDLEERMTGPRVRYLTV